jgi:hypothetical protein
MKNGKPATKGVCPTCGTAMFLSHNEQGECSTINFNLSKLEIKLWQPQQRRIS